MIFRQKLHSGCILAVLFFAVSVASPEGLHAATTFQRNIDFNQDWKFKRCEPAENDLDFSAAACQDKGWERVTLPHTPRIEPLVVNDQWQGLCWYRKTFTIDKKWSGNCIVIEFEAAMQIAEVWLNGRPLTTHFGGYLPFSIDITKGVLFGAKNSLALRLDNRDNPSVPPGKPLKELDFCMYGGLYRNVKLHILDRLQITDAVAENQAAGGGIFVRYPVVSVHQAQISVMTHVRNTDSGSRNFALVQNLYDDQNRQVASASISLTLAGALDQHFTQLLGLAEPALWHPDSPHRYTLATLLIQDKHVIDSVTTRIGIREISLNVENGFRINGEQFFLNGTNRHQEYPYVGYALPDNAQRRDAVKIKNAGFDFVRCSHYPQSPAFLDACDELGIVVMDAIPGWQFFGDSLFQQRSRQDCRDMIRRDRNHPSVIFWEVSLNESGMSNDFMEDAHRIAHEEYSGDQCISAGWMENGYDLFIPARQHAVPPDYWRNYATKPFIIAEYGDWEYYAQNAGFNQTGFKDLAPEVRNSRQLRGAGEKRLLQQALNYQEALNDNLASGTIGFANWLIFDYNRGYADDIEASGIMDIFRLPKFSYYFYASQRPPVPIRALAMATAPILFAATCRAADSAPMVKVFSNCEQVKIFADGVEIPAGERIDRYSNRLAYPPWRFDLSGNSRGELEVRGYVKGRQVAEQKIAPALSANKIGLEVALEGIAPQPGKKDLIFLHASVLDKNGRLAHQASNSILFKLKGPGRLIGPNPAAAEAGIASILVETSGKRGEIRIAASGAGLENSSAEIIIR